MVLDEELFKVLNTAKEELETMPTSDKLTIWQDLDNTKLDTSSLNFTPKLSANETNYAN